MTEHFYKNSFGSLKLSLNGNIITAEFNGSVSLSIAEYFIKTVELLIEDLNAQSWGYISYSENVDAATPDAQLMLIKAAKHFQQLGCVKSAYVLKSPIAIAQIDNLRTSMDVQAPVKSVLFDNLEQANEFMLNFLKTCN